MNPSEVPNPARPPLRKGWLLFMAAFVFLSILVPYLFWRGTWFGRPLTEEETARYLTDTKRPRKTQHALAQLADRIVRDDPEVRRWYPQIQALAGHEQPEVRATAAWVMGQDNQEADFHALLLTLLDDADPMVRRNASLSLVRFGDAGGRAEIVSMLRPYAVTSPHGGALRQRLLQDDLVDTGTLLARVQQGDAEKELRSPLPGELQRWLVADGAEVRAGDPVALLAPSEEQVWEALRALVLVGTRDELEDVERLARGVPGMPERIQQQAQLTADAIRRRAQTEAEGKTAAGSG